MMSALRGLCRWLFTFAVSAAGYTVFFYSLALLAGALLEALK
jgi:hypothetical protein